MGRLRFAYDIMSFANNEIHLGEILNQLNEERKKDGTRKRPRLCAMK